MATMGDVTVTLNTDAAVAALTAIRDRILDRQPGESDNAVLEAVHYLTQAALDQCRVEQGENVRMRAAFRELAAKIRDGEQTYSPITSEAIYRMRLTETDVRALEAILSEP